LFGTGEGEHERYLERFSAHAGGLGLPDCSGRKEVAEMATKKTVTLGLGRRRSSCPAWPRRSRGSADASVRPSLHINGVELDAFDVDDAEEFMNAVATHARMSSTTSPASSGPTPFRPYGLCAANEAARCRARRSGRTRSGLVQKYVPKQWDRLVGSRSGCGSSGTALYVFPRLDGGPLHGVGACAISLRDWSRWQLLMPLSGSDRTVPVAVNQPVAQLTSTG